MKKKKIGLAVDAQNVKEIVLSIANTHTYTLICMSCTFDYGASWCSHPCTHGGSLFEPLAHILLAGGWILLVSVLT